MPAGEEVTEPVPVPDLATVRETETGVAATVCVAGATAVVVTILSTPQPIALTELVQTQSQRVPSEFRYIPSERSEELEEQRFV